VEEGPKQSQLDHCFLIWSPSHRLFVIFTNQPAVNNAIIDSGLERTRTQLDARILRDSLLSTTVAPAFNDPSIVPSIRSIETWTDELGETFRIARDPVFPLQVSELKRWYVDCRSAFAQCYNRVAKRFLTPLPG
jgi:hypothetical protein